MIFRILLLPYSLKSRAQSPANRGIALPCISWAKVSVLKCQQIPITKKGAIFRKKLEEVLGDQLASLFSRARRRITLPALFRIEELGGDAGTTLSLRLQRLVFSLCAFYYYLLICYASLGWIRLWLR